MTKKAPSGFTLIELLVVIAIIGLLSSVVLASLNGARSRARDAERASNLKELQKALALYYAANGHYPYSEPAGGAPNNTWSSQCSGSGWNSNLAAKNVIPGLVPKYIGEYPEDPDMKLSANSNCLIYKTDVKGIDYKLVDYNMKAPSDPSKGGVLIDPRRNSTQTWKSANECSSPQTSLALAIWSSDTSRCW